MVEWELKKLKEVTTKIGSGATPRGGSNSYKDEGIALIRSQNVLDLQFSENGLAHIDEIQASALKYVEVIEKDILLNITGDSVARCCKIPRHVIPARVNQHVAIIRVNENQLLPDYLMYYLIYQKEELLSCSEIGATRRAITKGMIEDFEILLPSFNEQKAIASILSTLDDKIDLLHSQNKTLESMAETLFRQWFIERRPEPAEVEADESWEEILITELFEVRDGTHDSPKQKSSGKPLITSKHMFDHRLDIENAYLISEEDFEQVNKRSKVEKNDILFSMIGTIGLLYLEQSSKVNYAIKNIGLFKTSQNPTWIYFTYLWLNSYLGKDFIFEHRSGSTQEYISLGSLRSILFYVPNEKKLIEFNKIVKPLFDKIYLNTTGIDSLQKLRDTLLPKLMSGEVRCSEFTNGNLKT